jgi:ATP-binding cassette subfamily E protein 1
MKQLIEVLDLEEVLDRAVSVISGGELQRFAIAMACVSKADVYMFDEPSSYLDVKQRLNAAKTIRALIAPENYIICVEHDLSVLDYLSDFICVLYGMPSVYGVVAFPSSVREGINIFLDGNIPSENLRFREESLTFRLADTAEDVPLDRTRRFQYPDMTKAMGKFSLHVHGGQFTDSEIIVMLGENGTGKTTMVRMLAGALAPDNNQVIPKMAVSMKPQKISPRFTGDVRSLFLKKVAPQHALSFSWDIDVLRSGQIFCTRNSIPMSSNPSP